MSGADPGIVISASDGSSKYLAARIRDHVVSTPAAATAGHLGNTRQRGRDRSDLLVPAECLGCRRRHSHVLHRRQAVVGHVQPCDRSAFRHADRGQRRHIHGHRDQRGRTVRRAPRCRRSPSRSPPLRPSPGRRPAVPRSARPTRSLPLPPPAPVGTLTFSYRRQAGMGELQYLDGPAERYAGGRRCRQLLRNRDQRERWSRELRLCLRSRSWS